MKKTAIITGASSGMGREAAFEIADRFDVLDEMWLIARRKDRLLAAAARIPLPVRVIAADLTDPKGLDELRALLQKESPEVKFLVNAAGCGKMGPVDKVSVADDSAMIRLNCEALTAVTRAVLPYMGKNSRILEFSSASAFFPQPGYAVYAATKAYVLHYSRALGEELKPRGIGVTAVCPGPVKTEYLYKSGQKIPAYKRAFLADPKKVVRKAIRDSAQKKPVSVYGLSMKFFLCLGKLLPEASLIRLMARLNGVGRQKNGT